MPLPPLNILLRFGLICAICGLLAGCTGRGAGGSRPAMFEPVSLRINPTFTRIRPSTGGEQRYHVEADVELRDEFDDPTKAAGFIYFELYAYRPEGPDVRGEQIGEAAHYSLASVEAQRRHWQNIVRSYRFRLPWGGVDPEQAYVLTATYLPGREQAGRRMFDRLVILPHRDEAR